MKKLLSLSVIVFGIATLHAEEAGFQLSLTPDVALHPRETAIHGLSLNIWGENPQKSLTLGFVNGSTGDSGGFTLGLIGNYAESYTGVAWGLFNYSKTEFVGWQAAILNVSQGSFTGFQSGWINVAESFKGLQWGLVNYTEKMDGVQIGFINVITDNPWFEEFPNKLAKGFPIVNWSF